MTGTGSSAEENRSESGPKGVLHGFFFRPLRGFFGRGRDPRGILPMRFSRF